MLDGKHQIQMVQILLVTDKRDGWILAKKDALIFHLIMLTFAVESLD